MVFQSASGSALRIERRAQTSRFSGRVTSDFKAESAEDLFLAASRLLLSSGLDEERALQKPSTDTNRFDPGIHAGKLPRAEANGVRYR